MICGKELQVFPLLLYTFLLGFVVLGATDPFDVHVRKIKSGTAESVQAASAEEVIARLIPERAQNFRVIVDFKRPRNSFKLIKVNETIQITADSGVAACKAFYHYLKYYCGAHLSWEGQQLQSIPVNLPPVDEEVHSPSTIVYFQNVCTWSYSYSWWQWTDWRRHIDWIAMSGITLTLAPFQEDIWREVYHELGLSAKDIDEHLTGPGFFAWGRMGNIRGWGGPLSQNFTNSSSVLQKKIVDALRDLGISVALPSFAGHVPVSFRHLFPNASLVAVERWNRFSDKYCCPLFLDPVDPLFKRVGAMFLSKMIANYGSNHIYFSDPFNEVQPHLAEADYLRNASRGIFDVMQTVDSEAVWLLQGWMFVKNPFWSDQLLQAFLTAVPQGRILVLDLMSEQEAQFERTSSYFGQPFIWCMLHNFGGTLGMHGSVDKVYMGILEASRNKSYTMVGVGITPEGINQNYAVYEFALEMGWTPQNVTSVELWFKHYPAVRYGKEDSRLSEAWRILQQTVYSYKGVFVLHGKYTICRRPSLKIYPFNWYNISDLVDAWELFLEASGDFPKNSLFNHDLVDITRQVLQNRSDEVYLSIVELYKQRNMTELVKECSTFLDLLVDMDRILATHRDFLLGPFLESAKAVGSTEMEGLALAFNAKNQITLWGPNGEISDYANKQWSGVILDYFYPRWHVFFLALEVAVKTNRKVNETEFRDRIFQEIELPFNVDNRDYPTYSRGNSVQISREIFEKWRHRQAHWPQVPYEATTVPSNRKPKLINSFRTKEKLIVATLI